MIELKNTILVPSQLITIDHAFNVYPNGNIYIGKIDTDPAIPKNQIQVYLEHEDGTYIPVPQPLSINPAGYPVYNELVAKFVTDQNHSMAVYDSCGSQ
ncbi:phage tailspike protein [Xenorhabdus bovienii]|nr:phage head-binding domain-containing protein [Xenorhabdus bovienii]